MSAHSYIVIQNRETYALTNANWNLFLLDTSDELRALIEEEGKLLRAAAERVVIAFDKVPSHFVLGNVRSLGGWLGIRPRGRRNALLVGGIVAVDRQGNLFSHVDCVVY